MNSRAAIVGMGLLAIVAVLAIQADSERGIILDYRAGEQNIGPSPRLVKYTQEKLRSFPRGPLPKTWQGAWIVTNDYPQAALNNDLEGRVGFTLSVDPYGEVANCTITHPSGVKAFDQKVCASLVTRARFYPALDDEQQPVSGTFSSTVVWTIEEDDLTGKPADIRGTIDGQGRIVECAWVKGAAQETSPMEFCQAIQAAQAEAGELVAGPFTISTK